MTPSIDILDFMRGAAKQYGRHVVEDRAFSESRDGLNPVRKRVLQTMYETGLFPNKPYVKSARVVGNVLGWYHPHGDSSCYDTIVRMANSRYPMVDGQGNWGDLTSPAAAFRYTECRLTKLAMLNFGAWDVRETVPNYDGTRDEVLLMPTRLPMMMMNGGYGIGYGTATNIPSHNLKEIVNCAAAIILDPDISDDDILSHIHGPDLPYGGVLLSSAAEVREVYRTGNGKLEFRANYHYEVSDSGVHELVITGFPPNFKLKKGLDEPEDIEKNPGFMELCEMLRVSGQIEYIEDQNPTEGYRIVVGFTNPYPIQTQVLGWLTKSVVYTFNVLHKYEEEDIQFFESNVPDIMRDWVEYRKWVEVHLLIFQRKEMNIKLERETAREKVLKNVQALIDILMDLNVNDKVAAIAKNFKVTSEMANYILDSPTRTWTNTNLTVVQDSIKNLNAEIADRTKRIRRPGAEVMTHLKNLMPFYDDRRTLVRQPEPELPGAGGSAGYLGVFANAKGKLSTNHSIGDFAVDGSDGFLYIGTDGQATRYLTVPGGRAHHNKTAGLVALNKPLMVALGSDGKGGYVNTSQKKSPFQVIKMAAGAQVTQVAAMQPGDTLWLWDHRRDKIERYSFDECQTKYAGSQSGTLMKNRTKGVEFQVVGDTDNIVLRNGLINYEDAQILAEGVFIVGDVNLVKVGIRRSIKNREVTLKAIKKGTVSQVIKII